MGKWAAQFFFRPQKQEVKKLKESEQTEAGVSGPSFRRSGLSKQMHMPWRSDPDLPPKQI
jgi:hypothetical protein